MTAVPTLGFDASADVALDLERLLVSRLLIQANSGGGKSQAIRYLLEQTHGRVQHIVIDREGEFSTLRTKYPYLLVGPGGEVAADVRGAKLLARKLLELQLSAIIDLSDLSLAQQREYVTAFVTAMCHLPRALWRDCLVVVDEAHLFAPQRTRGESYATTEAIALLASIGRKRGYALVLATQRIAKLDKDVSAELLNKLIGRTSNEDLARAGEELAFDRRGARELRSLAPGQFWAYGPAIGMEPVLVRTGDIATRPPTRGLNRAPAPPTPAAIAKVAASLADLPQQAETETRTLADLQQQLAAARAELARAQKTGTVVEKPVVDQAAIDRSVKVAIADAERVWSHRAREVTVRLRDVPADLRSMADSVDAALAILADVPSAPKPVTAPIDRIAPAAPARVERAATATSTEVSAPQQRILDALASFVAIGIDEVSKSNVAVFSDQSPTSSGFANNLGRLRSLGLIAYPRGGFVALTDEGHNAANPQDVPASLGELHRAWGAKLPVPQWNILAALIRAYPQPIERAALAELVQQSPTSSGYANNLGSLRSLGLLDYPQRGYAVATSLLFPEGVR